MARSEHPLCLSVLYNREILQVSALAELVMPVGIAVIHHNPRLAVNALAYTHTLHGLVRLVNMGIVLCPLASGFLPWLCRQSLGCSLEYAPSALTLVKKMIESVAGVIHNVTVDSCGTIVEEKLRLAFKVGEIVIHV